MLFVVNSLIHPVHIQRMAIISSLDFSLVRSHTNKESIKVYLADKKKDVLMPKK